MSDRGSGRPSRPGFARRAALAAALLGTLAGPLAPLAHAVTGLELSTPFPAVVVEPGGTATFDLAIDVTTARRVDLSVSGVPSGWEARLRGGGLVVDGAFITPDTAPDLSLSVDVPDDARPGTSTITVTAVSGSLSESLELDLRVQEAAEGDVSIESDFPELSGSSDATFTFNMNLNNDTPGEITFGLSGTGPDGWTVRVVPSGEDQATSATVAAAGSERLAVTVTPPQTVDAGTYPVVVTATGGGRTAEIQLGVTITGTFSMAVGTKDEVLSAAANAGSPTTVVLTIQNTGTAPLTGITLAPTTPSNWTLTFDPETVGDIAPGQVAEVAAVITPANAAIAGDYSVSVRATTAETSGAVALRIRVETPSFWWIVGVGLIVLTFAGLSWVFRTYGRR